MEEVKIMYLNLVEEVKIMYLNSRGSECTFTVEEVKIMYLNSGGSEDNVPLQWRK